MKFKIDKTVFEKFPEMVEVVPIVYGFNAGIKEKNRPCFWIQCKTIFKKYR